MFDPFFQCLTPIGNYWPHFNQFWSLFITFNAFRSLIHFESLKYWNINSAPPQHWPVYIEFLILSCRLIHFYIQQYSTNQCWGDKDMMSERKVEDKTGPDYRRYHEGIPGVYLWFFCNIICLCPWLCLCLFFRLCFCNIICSLLFMSICISLSPEFFGFGSA